MAVVPAVGGSLATLVGIAGHPAVTGGYALVTHGSVAGTQFKLVDEIQRGAVLEPGLLRDTPTGGHRREEGPLVSLGEVGRTVVTELAFQEVTIGKVIVQTTDE